MSEYEKVVDVEADTPAYEDWVKTNPEVAELFDAICGVLDVQCFALFALQPGVQRAYIYGDFRLDKMTEMVRSLLHMLEEAQAAERARCCPESRHLN